MINYDGKNWLESVRHFKTSYVIRKTLRMTLGMGLYTGAIYTCERLFQNHPELVPLNIHVVKIEPAVFSLLGILLSLLLVFRTNTAYEGSTTGKLHGDQLKGDFSGKNALKAYQSMAKTLSFRPKA